ncbi:glycosyl hydrolase family protein [Jiangella aurantiaca]|uniref:Glycosyl hydrolase family protein n=1 Tax=Jiangella aurantiaca TaxID=2530373 RepID=A0A4R5A8K3_9ACTN|nr:family 16 glycosylhydrolase [Jiangella aurantiaca]TDD67004.1 glycosyl hydrolase family protein [Jiangella aurantiaca]
MRVRALSTWTSIPAALAVATCTLALAAPATSSEPAAARAATSAGLGILAAPSGYQLSWADEFNTTSVDTTRWDYRTGRPWDGWSTQLPENVSVGGGVMTIHLCPEKTSGPECTPTSATTYYTGGGLISKAKPRYGYYETRVRTNVGSGWHSAFWSAEVGATGAFTEIDGFEIDSHIPDQAMYNVIAWNHGGHLSSKLRALGFDSSADWHVYGFEWTEDKVVFYVDGTQVWQTDYAPSTYVHNFLNIWLTTIAIGRNGSPGVDDDALPGKVQWDYFRFYERDAYGDNDSPTGGYAESGTGWGTSGLPAFGRLTSRYSCDPGTSAHWTVRPPATGSYRAYFYRVGGDGGQAGAPVTVSDGGTTLASASVDFGPAGNAWVPIGGALTLTEDRPYTVRVERTGAGCIRADAVKFVRQ